MNCDQKYDEQREQEYIDRIHAEEDAALTSHFQQHNLTVDVGRWPSSHIMSIRLTNAELARHGEGVTPQRIADIVTEHTGNQWSVTEVKPSYNLIAGDAGYPNLPLGGIQIKLGRAL